jgi:hypothetical protein
VIRLKYEAPVLGSLREEGDIFYKGEHYALSLDDLGSLNSREEEGFNQVCETGD